jgi:hypothetical protein
MINCLIVLPFFSISPTFRFISSIADFQVLFFLMLILVAFVMTQMALSLFSSMKLRFFSKRRLLTKEELASSNLLSVAEMVMMTKFGKQPPISFRYCTKVLLFSMFCLPLEESKNPGVSTSLRSRSETPKLGVGIRSSTSWVHLRKVIVS